MEQIEGEQDPAGAGPANRRGRSQMAKSRDTKKDVKKKPAKTQKEKKQEKREKKKGGRAE